MKTPQLLGIALLAISLGLSGCGEIETPVEPTPDPKPEEIKSEITIDADIITNGLSFTSAKGEKSISFTTNEDWTLSIATTQNGDAWCSASTTSGAKGNANVKFSVTENISYDNRSVSVTIKSGTASKTFTITQKYAEALLLTTNKYELSQDGGTIEIEVKANIDYEMEIAESAKDWITEAKTRALTTYKHTLTIATNEEVEKREGEIYFKSGDKIETVKIYQEGAEAIIVLSQKEYTVSDTGETISVDIKSNIEYDVQMPDVDWISAETPTRSMSSHTLKYIVSPNDGYDSRTAEIVFYDENSDLKETVKIVQVQKDAIIVAQNEYIVNSDGSNLEFEVSANVDFEVTTSVDWIKQNVETRSLDSKPLSFTIEDNTAEIDREGIITISSGELKQEIKVKQQRKIYFNFSSTEVNLTSNGGEFTIEVATNGGYTITMPEVDWLIQGEIGNTIAYMTYANTFVAAANATYESRETEIKFKNIWNDEVVFVKVKQAPYDGTYIGDIILETKEQFKEFKKAGYKKIQGNLTIDNIAIPDTIDIKHISGDLTINCRELTTSNLGYFYNLIEIGGNLHIWDRSYYYEYGSVESKVTSFDGLKNLESIGGDLKISGRVSDKVWYKDYTYGDGEYGHTSHAFYHLSRMELPKLQSIGGSLIVEITYAKVTPKSTWHRWGTRTNDYGKAFEWLESVRFDNLSSVGEEINITDIFRDRSEDDIDIQINLPY